jgi:hypothetical protein
MRQRRPLDIGKIEPAPAVETADAVQHQHPVTAGGDDAGERLHGRGKIRLGGGDAR